jgi:hypothetical protein
MPLSLGDRASKCIMFVAVFQAIKVAAGLNRKGGGPQ